MRDKVLKLLALVLAAACLMTATALSEMPMEIDPEQGCESIAPQIDMGSLDLSLASGEGLDLSEPTTDDAPSADDAAAISSNEAAAVSSNDDDSPFEISDEGVLVRYTGEGGDVVIPDGVLAIGRKAFADCASMKSVTIPESVNEICANAFNGCANLAYATVLSMQIDINATAFKGTKPVFRTVIGSNVAEWAKKHRFEVEENVVVLKANTTMKANIGDTYRIVLKGVNAISYVSSNLAVATVTDKGLVSVKNGGTVQITVTLESKDMLVLTLNVAFPAASLSKTSLALKAGRSATLTIVNLSGRTVTWETSKADVATVDNGKVTAFRKGGCVITATLSDGTVLKCKVRVTDPARLNKKKLKLRVGESATLKVHKLNGRSVSWSSSDNGVATVQGGKVTAHKAGSCTVTAQIQNGKALKCKVTVTDPASLSKTSLKLKVGESHTLKVNHLGGRSVSWSSSDNGVATVQDGKVTARKAGSCTVTAKIQNGKSLTCKVTVTDAAKLNKTSLSLQVGGTFTLKVSDLGGRSVSWSSSDNGVATVQDGKVTARKAGSCTVTARLSDGKALTCKVTVTDSARLNKTELTLKEGATFKLVVTGQGSNTVTWSSSDQKIATVDKTGLVKAVKVGKCVITAKLSNGKSLQCKVTVNKK